MNRLSRDVSGRVKRFRVDVTKRKASDTESSIPPTSVRRKKSRSPSRSRTRADPFVLSSSGSVKKKKSANTTAFNETPIVAEDAPDHGHRMKAGQSKPSGIHSRSSSVAPTSTSHRSRKEKEGECDGDRSRYSSSEKDGDKKVVMYSGPLAMAEFERMKREIEQLKKTVHDNKKTIKKQNETIKNLRTELDSEKLAIKNQETQLETLKTRSRQKEEVLETIEANLQCQICMELLFKPYALSPCGHVLCLSCLQEWFRKAPPSADDMEIDEDINDPEYIIHRQKSCPCCRAVIYDRPVPVFLVKSVASTLIKARGPGHTAASPLSHMAGSSSATTDDVWKGLFPDDTCEEEEQEEYDYDDEVIRWFTAPYDDSDEYESYSSDEDGSMGELEDDVDSTQYVQPVWEPPTVYYRARSRHSLQFTQMMRRGCTREMINTYGMTYTHEDGLVAYVYTLDSDTHVRPYRPADRQHMISLFLGWNVVLEPRDHDGHGFMNQLLIDYREHPERFSTHRLGASLEIKKLVREDDVQAVSDDEPTDSEYWHDNRLDSDF
ncbi:uncharacterized protein EV420DRAFT_1335264 [Desarmillaria tabescens]|uniref:RING-type domain-containing protein n=1 Tax=Armillaria tabescens TaxID=1929756 RepID=A0AA39KDB4_ARMTA|nr:uncharacterized protein EV420DRAFT_1335264 [Desarmillaria tabescens]KAK0457860.1 hypothetical protein EV420DRAFT_1335264 [Desarmillaria tabescens]